MRPDSTGPARWPHVAAALCLADTRRRLNLMSGAGAEGRRRRRAAVVILSAGTAAVLGALALLGRTLGALAPVGGLTPAGLASLTWAPAVAWTAAQLLGADLSSARSLVRPADTSVLRTLPVSRGQVVAARLVVPTAGTALALLVALGAVALPWLAATGHGRDLLPVLAVNACGTVVVAGALRVLLVALFMVRVTRIAQLPRALLAAVAGCCAGLFAAPFVRNLGATPDEAEATVTRLVADALAAGRPGLWTTLHTPARLGWTAAGYLAVAVLAAATAALRVRATARRDAANPSAPYRIHHRTARRPRTAPRRPTPLSLVVKLTRLRLRRGDPAVVGGLARLQRLSIACGAFCAGIAAALDRPLWQLPAPALAGLLIAAALTTTGEVIQSCGIEADRASWDLLRQSPLPSGAWPAAKAVACALAVLAVTAPLFLGVAALGGVSGAEWGVTVLLLPVVALAAGGASVLTWYAVPRTEGFDAGRVSRPPTADLVEGVFAALLTLPATAGLALIGSLTDGTANSLLGCALLGAVLAVYALGLRRLSGTDLPGPRPPLAHRPPGKPQ
ncbi:hypothetical protein ACWCPS_11795 [Streptomyces mauvecolor]